MKTINKKLQCALASIGGVSLILMLLVAVSDIISRSFGYAFSGAYEIIGWLSATAIGCSLGYTQMHKGHVTIDFINGLKHELSKSIIAFSIFLASLLITSIIGIQLMKYAFLIYKVGSLSETLMWPVYPWVFMLAFAFFAFAFSFMVDVFHEGKKLINIGNKKISRTTGLKMIPDEECGL